MAVLPPRFHDQVFTPFDRSVAETVSGRFDEVHFDGADRLGSMGPILFLRLHNPLVGRLAEQFYSPFAGSDSCWSDNSYRVCDHLQSVLRDLKGDFVFLRIVVRTGSLPACMGALRDDRNFQPASLRFGFVLVASLSAGSPDLATRSRAGHFGGANRVQDELSPRGSGLHNCPASNCIRTVCSASA